MAITKEFAIERLKTLSPREVQVFRLLLTSSPA